jgi:bacterial/archaeal transporter family protein
MWLFLAVFSSFLLGVYDLFKKSSLKRNAFLPVLFLATCTGAILFLFIVGFSRAGIIDPGSEIFVPVSTLKAHGYFFLKAVIVGVSWFFAYMALSNLPITIVVPIRSTGPIWTVTGAFLIFHERFNFYQWSGIVLAIISSYMFALAGKKEGITFHKNKWVLAIVAATLIGSVSSLFDKYLLQHYHRMAIQAWFSIYMVVVLLPFLLVLWVPKRKNGLDFHWRWTIPAIGITLSMADFLYFYALSYPSALIGVISVIRRSSVIIAFTFGAILFKEDNIKSKAIALLGILIGVVFLVLGS